MQNIVGAIDHLKGHMDWPADKAKLLAACQGLSDFSEEDKKEFSDQLPDGTYKSAEEVIKTLGWES